MGNHISQSHFPSGRVIVFCAIASYIIPAGVYDRVKDVQTGKMVVDPSTFHYVAQKPTGFLDFFTSINKGFKGGISIIAFLFMVGGSLNILAKTDAGGGKGAGFRGGGRAA